MVKIVTFNGGLGNQMFIYAFYYVLCLQSKLSFVEIDIENTYGQHNGFELFRLFKAIQPKNGVYYRRIKNLTIKYRTKYLFKKIDEDTLLRMPTNDPYPFSLYTGFWQSERYFKAYAQDIRRIFAFDTTALSKKSAALLPVLHRHNTVGIHVRRGDYTEHVELRDICTKEYYQSAIETMSREVPDAYFFIFTNDIAWVRQHFNWLVYELIDWNTQQESWQDMYLMTQCRHNIIANSSFSWWGAWLNNNPDKVVVAPSRWFNTLQVEHILPTSWLRV